MKKYIWCWAYEGGCSINTADTLKDIVNIYVNSHYYDSDSIAIDVIDDRIKVEIIYDQTKSTHEIEETEDAVCDFLQELANEMCTQESFSIKNTNVLFENTLEKC